MVLSRGSLGSHLRKVPSSYSPDGDSVDLGSPDDCKVQLTLETPVGGSMVGAQKHAFQ